MAENLVCGSCLCTCACVYIYLCMYVFVSVYVTMCYVCGVYTYLSMGVHVCVWKPEVNIECIRHWYLFFFLRQALSLNVELTYSARLTSQPAPRSSCLDLHSTENSALVYFPWCWGPSSISMIVWQAISPTSQWLMVTLRVMARMQKSRLYWVRPQRLGILPRRSSWYLHFISRMLGTMALVCDPSTWEAEARGSGAQCQLGLCSEFKASLGYMRHWKKILFTTCIPKGNRLPFFFLF